MLATLKDLKKTRHQTLSFLGGSLLMISSGVYITHDLFNPFFSLLPVTIHYQTGIFLLLKTSWHLGGISGFFAAPFYISTFSKKTIYVSFRENKFLLPFLSMVSRYEHFYKLWMKICRLALKIFQALAFDGNDKSFAISPLV